MSATTPPPRKLTLWRTGLSTGLGICGSCGVPGAYGYRNAVLNVFTWQCDSCVDPSIVHARIDHKREMYRP